VPPRALAISLLALAVPLTATAVLPSWFESEGMLLAFLPVLLPAFLLSYYKGWKGASLALAAGMATLALSQAEILALDVATPRWDWIFLMVTMLVVVSLGSGWLAERLLTEREKAESAALTDVLTGLPNRRHLAVFLEWAWAAAVRGRPMSVVIFDLDDFKAVNDEHGHAAGDKVIRAFAEVLSNRGRKMDLITRFGGEEFLSVLVDCELDQALMYADSIRQKMEEVPFDWGPVTVSGGVACMEPGMTSPDVLIAAADRALYRAKEEGRNRVSAAHAVAQGHAPVPVPPKPREWREGIRVLLVDDDDGALLVTSRVLTQMGCVVTTAPSGVKAIKILESDPSIDILVTDIVMPEMSGFTLVDLASEARADLPVLYVSGYEQQMGEWPGAPGGASAFLRKPIEPLTLQAAISALTSPISDGAVAEA
jgi:diguanylate cyclase (GGDEF)-like protein